MANKLRIVVIVLLVLFLVNTIPVAAFDYLAYVRQKLRFLSAADSNSPTWSNFTNNASNVTQVGESVNWEVLLADDMGLDGYKFAHNDTGVLTNSSFVKKTGLSASLQTIIRGINSTENMSVCGLYWFNDTQNNINTTGLSCFVVSSFIDKPPAVFLNNPHNGNTSYFENMSFDCNASDEVGLKNISLWHNITGTWMLNQSKLLTGILNATTFNVTYLPVNGTFIWNCEAYDTVAGSSFHSTNYTFRYINRPGAEYWELMVAMLWLNTILIFRKLIEDLDKDHLPIKFMLFILGIFMLPLGVNLARNIMVYRGVSEAIIANVDTLFWGVIVITVFSTFWIFIQLLKASLMAMQLRSTRPLEVAFRILETKR